MQGMPEGETTAITLQKGGRSSHIVFLAIGEAIGKTASDEENARWRLLSRSPLEDSYCLMSAGRNLEVLASLHAIEGFSEKFGLPGSGYRRCNDASDGPLGSVAVRSWANKSLGESLIQSFSRTDIGKGVTLLVASEPVGTSYPWILLSKETDSLTTCYYDVGENSIFHSGFALRGELKADPSTIPPLE